MPGFVILATSLEIFITGSKMPSFSLALILKTPPKDGEPSAVMIFVPTPQLVTVQPCSFRDWMRYSSRSFEPEMMASGNPASVNMRLASLER